MFFSAENSEVRFSFNPVGINKLRETFKTLFGGRRTGNSHVIGYDEDEEREGGLYRNWFDLLRSKVSCNIYWHNIE